MHVYDYMCQLLIVLTEQLAAISSQNILEKNLKKYRTISLHSSLINILS